MNMSKLVLLIFFWTFSPVAAMGASAVITSTVERS